MEQRGDVHVNSKMHAMKRTLTPQAKQWKQQVPPIWQMIFSSINPGPKHSKSKQTDNIPPCTNQLIKGIQPTG